MRSAVLWCWGCTVVIIVLLGFCALVSQSPQVASAALVSLMFLCTVFFCRIVALEARLNTVKALHEASDILRNEEWDR